MNFCIEIQKNYISDFSSLNFQESFETFVTNFLQSANNVNSFRKIISQKKIVPSFIIRVISTNENLVAFC